MRVQPPVGWEASVIGLLAVGRESVEAAMPTKGSAFNTMPPLVPAFALLQFGTLLSVDLPLARFFTT